MILNMIVDAVLAARDKSSSSEGWNMLKAVTGLWLNGTKAIQPIDQRWLLSKLDLTWPYVGLGGKPELRMQLSACRMLKVFGRSKVPQHFDLACYDYGYAPNISKWSNRMLYYINVHICTSTTYK